MTSRPYRLRGFEHVIDGARYVDPSASACASFEAVERIFVGDGEVYRLDYRGGIVKARGHDAARPTTRP